MFLYCIKLLTKYIMNFISNLIKNNIKRPVGSYHMFQIIIYPFIVQKNNKTCQCATAGVFQEKCKNSCYRMTYFLSLFFFKES